MKVMYVTVLTEGFEVQALTLARSIIELSPDSEFLFFCLDDISKRHLENLLPARTQIIEYSELQTPELDKLKEERAPGPFCWTCKSVLLSHVLSKFSYVDWAVYVDSDMMAFSDPNIRLNQSKDNSVVLTPHAFRYYPFIGTENLVGTYNAGYIAFKNNSKGNEILHWWMQKCLNHCPPIPDPDAYGDQKYLDRMATKYSNHVSIGFPDTNLAPWNIAKDSVSLKGEQVYFQSQKVVIFHFQGCKLAHNHFIDLYAGNMRISKSLRQFIFKKYKRNLKIAYTDLRKSTSYSISNKYSLPYLIKCFLLSLISRHNMVKW
ncbi:hypothetical protein [Kiloniella majae]|uniref:hypothetical protein n=1 Tax=Kiloniella majae TaxID=1938558 RepID=UPI000A27740D|nr:hypothetical protein [Kiloniella majae]